ncbi:PKD domain-containing protein [Mucilaginibacter terrigena]|uniref:PKD domain-containing protein n=1 Tax=Mucilaginibacter terrigena TaxID=2492395 RepID=A0A4Q5LPX9_9SPHI|nr:PKD domain-containing protein [Mucilaginibacter terrigena]RYU91453.1 PKD domain-containing protein [Mucilaginibacter terrigena]
MTLIYKNTIKAVTVALLLFVAHTGFGQSSQGKEFWTTYMTHIESPLPSQMVLYITGDVDTKGVVEIANSSFEPIPFTVKAKKVTIVAVPHKAMLTNQGRVPKGIHITAEKKIAVYAHIYAQNVSGATLLLPTNVLGQDYISINYSQASNADKDHPAYSIFCVIATEDNTTIEITPSQALKSGQRANVPYLIQMSKGDVYQAMSLGDLSRSKIRSISTNGGECKKIAVFSGASKIGIGCTAGNFSSDNLFQQVYPKIAWGKNFVTVPLQDRHFDIYRIYSSEPNTHVTIDGVPQNPAYLESDNLQIVATKPVVIRSDKPIQVAQYSPTQGRIDIDICEEDLSDLGDPEMIYLNPLEQSIDHVTLYSSSFFAIKKNFINVVIKTDQIPGFRIDKLKYTNFKRVPYDTTFSYAQIPVNYGTHYLSANEGFNAVAYGFGDHESYGYSAGTSVKNLNQYIVFNDLQKDTTRLNGCAGIEYKLKLALPFEASNIKWTLADGTVFTDAHPVLISQGTNNGKPIYFYEYYKKVSFSPGDYSITATVPNPEVNVCGPTIDIDFDFNITPYPVASGEAEVACVGAPTVFHDTSDPKGALLTKWLWDFGDGQTSFDQNPVHTYTTAGDYEARLSIANDNDCGAVSAVIKVHVRPAIQVSFTSDAPICEQQGVTFHSTSSVPEGHLVQWIWDYGDGKKDTLATDVAVHSYDHPGIYNVKHTVFTDAGCNDSTTVTGLQVNPIPVVDFSLPAICTADNAAFTDKSTISDNSEAGFTYLWNFGDANATAANPNTSSQKDPHHRYTQPGTYTATLTITTASGCSVTKTHEFFVSGSNPKAKFAVENAENLCSANAVTIKDESTVDPGTITKIKIWYDFAAHPEVFEVFEGADLHADKKYVHVYDLATDARQYTIHMEAYSGVTCFEIHDEVITVKGNPVVSLPALGPFCTNDDPVQIVPDNHGFAMQSSYFSGTGVTSGGVFSPAVVGRGDYEIIYHFVAQNGCETADTMYIRVNDVAVVHLAESVTSLEGESTRLTAEAIGIGMTYKWTPEIAINNSTLLSPVVSPVDDITYTLTVTNGYGCEVKASVFVDVLKKIGVVNTFTPNGDGINDTWVIKNIETYPGNTVDIYNRQGEKVYSSVGYAIPWDGRYKGTLLPTGTYYYIINPKNGRKVISGSVTIIK